MPIVAEHLPSLASLGKMWKISQVEVWNESLCLTQSAQHMKDCQRTKLEQLKDLHCLYYVILIPGKISSGKLAPVFA